VQPQILAELDILQKDKIILEEKNAELCKEIEQLKNNQQNITNNNNIKINIQLQLQLKKVQFFSRHFFECQVEVEVAKLK